MYPDYAPDLSRMVYVGEGLTPADQWWAVVTSLAPDNDPHTPSSLAWMTNQPGLPEGQPGDLYGPGALNWDSERQARAEAAQAKAFACVQALSSWTEGCLAVGERIETLIEAAGQSARVAKVFALSRSTGDWYAVAAVTWPGGNRGPWITDASEFYLYRFPSDIEGWSAEELATGHAAAESAAACLGG
jgi:hypothetical protein